MEYKTFSKKQFLITCHITTVLKSIILSYALSLILFLLFAFIITYASVPYSAVTPISIVITLLSILAASITNGRKSTEKGWLTGCVTGFIYMIILYIVGSIIFRTPVISSKGIIMIIGGVICGSLGSIIGINNKKTYTKR